MTEEEKKKQNVAEANAERAAANAEQVSELGNAAPEAQQTEPGAEGAGAAPTPSQREQYMNSYREAYPDLDPEDEEAFYTQANNNYRELQDARSTRKALGEALQKHPEINDLVVLASRGENPWEFLAKNMGIDIRDMGEDPDFASKIGEAMAEYNRTEAERKQKEEASEKEKVDADKQMTDNLTASAQILQELQKERGMSDEEAGQVFADFFANVITPGREGNVSKEVWEAYIKSRNYDNDIKSARDEAAMKALNEKFQNKVKRPETDVPPTLPSGGGRQRKSGGFFAGVK